MRSFKNSIGSIFKKFTAMKHDVAIPRTVNIRKWEKNYEEGGLS